MDGGTKMILCEECGRKLTRQLRMCKKCAYKFNKEESNYVLEEE